MNREWVVDVVARLPQGMVSRAWGWLARRRQPRLGVSLLKRGFVAATGIDMREAADPVASYQTLEELFIRPLKSGARRVDPDPSAVVSPVDGIVGACGMIHDGLALQVKGRHYSVAKLLGSAAEAERYEGGQYMTFYLSPKDYHRVHAPLAGRVNRARVIPGALMPVFQESLERVEELFARNERLITYVDHERAGRVAVVKVGATLVGRITVAYDETLRANDPRVVHLDREYDPAPTLQKGGELGVFALGSTVVLLFEPETLEVERLESGRHIRLGERIATLPAVRARSSEPREERFEADVVEKNAESSASSKKKSSRKTSSSKKTSKKKVAKKKASTSGSSAPASASGEVGKKANQKKTRKSPTKKAKTSRKKTSVKKKSTASKGAKKK